MPIYDSYDYLFKLYLEVVREGYEKDRPYESWEDCRRYCERFCLKLYGMLSLMRECGTIDGERYDLERERVAREFRSERVYQANKRLFG